MNFPYLICTLSRRCTVVLLRYTVPARTLLPRTRQSAPRAAQVEGAHAVRLLHARPA